MSEISDIAQLTHYLKRHFVALGELAALGGVVEARVIALIEARAIPGPIYSLWPNGAFSSPIGGSHAGPPSGTPIHWYAPAAAWWVRRAQALSPNACACAFETHFVNDFVTRLAAEPAGHLGYPQVYLAGTFDPAAATLAARSEWQDWLDGGYGVCLRHADAYHAITKTCRRAEVLAMTDNGQMPTLSEAQMGKLLTVMEELDSVMLPFAPHQRPHGTPGLWIDYILARYGLGRTRELAASPLLP